MTLKLATEAEYHDIRRMTLAFKAKSPYASFPHTETKLDYLIDQFISGPHNERICILSMDGDKAVGLIAGVTSEFLWNEEIKFAAELMWWVDPEYRQSTRGKELKKAFEYWSRLVKTWGGQLSLLNDKSMDRLEKFYKRDGYIPMERSYLKEWR